MGVVAVTMAAAGAAWAAEAPKGSALEGLAFSADSTLVLVPVTVVDHRGAIVNGLGG
jgi:hypothetical protein